MYKLPTQNLLPLQTASLGAQPEAVSGKCRLEPVGPVGSRVGQVAQAAGRQFWMAAAVLRKTCCRKVCKSAGRALRGQEASVAVRSARGCSQDSFLLFFREVMQTYPLGYSCAWWIVECAFRDSVRWDIIANKIIFL